MIKNTILAISVFLLVPRLAAQDNNANLREEMRKLEMAHAAAIFKGDAEALDNLMDNYLTTHNYNHVFKE